MSTRTWRGSRTTARDAGPVPHSLLEDVLGLLVGTFVVSLGLVILRAGSLVTGGTAGLSLLLSQAFPVPFGLVFATVNLPFFLLAVRGKGWKFSIYSAVAIALVSAMSSLHTLFVPLTVISPLYAAAAGNILCGVGLIALFRHTASLGGFNIVALVMQDRFGTRAGYVLMVLDSAVIASSLLLAAPLTVVVSAAGAVLLNLILAINHRPGRYTGS
ncbi:YitT family protein [Antribacter sp. KLBMP9083]|uniref:YitT family protein n=1 Tax=Antribacter soli TaxID=2910976 RepID=A0AA41QFQ8_9MICO|nr:YitT family protein [Antribacter soli]MCF4121347.1 YitT family protein [Antribacter soli]